jgi:hypothetical protein
MPLTIWKEAGRRCTVTVNGAAIAVQLLDGDHLLQERVVGSADQALDLAEVWKVHRPTPPPPVARGPRQTAPRPSSHQQDGSAATPRVMWIDRR